MWGGALKGGYAMGKWRDWTGTRIGNITILGRGPVNTHATDRHSLWVGLCDCGKKRLVRSSEMAKGTARTCGEANCPYRNVIGKRKQVRKAKVSLTHIELQEAMNQPCRMCGTPADSTHVLGLYNPKLGYRTHNTFTLCSKCKGMQPRGKQTWTPPSFKEIILHLCSILNYLSDTGDIALAPELKEKLMETDYSYTENL
jgi:hypothetical protein